MATCLENAMVRLLRGRPFYGQFLLNLRREERPLSGKPAGVTIRDGIPTLAVDPASLALLSPPEQCAVLEHLVKHLLHLHPLRRKERNQHDWDTACDLAVNPGVADLPRGALYPVQYRMADGLAAEEYYDQLVRPFDVGNLEGSGYGTADEHTRGASGEGCGDGALGTLDDHLLWSAADSTPFALGLEMVRAITRESLRGADAQVPPEIREVVDLLLFPSPVPWRQVLRQFVASAGRVGRRSSWMREHRRFGHDTPGVRKRHRLNLLVGIDVSDSTDSVAIREAFARELLAIAKGRDSSLTVLYANSRVQRIETLRGTAPVVLSYAGGGFTDLRPVFEYAKTMRPLPAAVIYLTDGIGPAPKRMEFPTLWVVTGAGEKPVPWGVELRLEV